MRKKRSKKAIDTIVPKELTFFQRVALQSEVSMCYEMSMHNPDKLYYTYMLCASTQLEYLSFYKEEILNYITEDQFQTIIRYAVNDIFPTSLYVDKFLADILGLVGYSEFNQKDKLPKISKEILRSKLLSFIRIVGDQLPSVVREILRAIMADDTGRLDFLKEVAFMVLPELEGAKDKIKSLTKKIGLLQHSIMEYSVSSFMIETQALNTLNTLPEDSEKVTDDELLDIVNTVLGKNVDNKIYQVNKIDRATKAVVFTKEFTSHAKALEYVKSIGNDYPDILQRYEFVIVTEKGE